MANNSIAGIWDGNISGQAGNSVKAPKPFFTCLGKDENHLHAWLKGAFEFCREYYKPYNRALQQNISLYQGLTYDRGQSREEYDEKTYREGIDLAFDYPCDPNNFTNYAHELTEELVSSVTTYRPSIATYPANSDEPQDILNAITVKQLLDTIMYDTRWEVSVPQFVRNVKVGGECWQFITWNKNKGDLTPAAKDATSQWGSFPIPLLGEDGKPVLKDGEPQMIESPPRVGDVEITYTLAEHVFPQPVPFGQEREWVMRLRFDYTETLKARHRQKSKDIAPDKGGHWDFSQNKMEDLGEITTYVEFWHKVTDLVPKGYECKFTTETVLEASDLTYRHGELPGEELTDLDVPGVTRGLSYLRNTRNLQKMINHLNQLVHRNFDLFAHPKWIVEIGSINKKHLRRMPGIIPLVPGTNPPKLLQLQSTHPEIYQYIEACVEKIRVLSGVHPISQGQVPTGLESGIAIGLLREEENKRRHSFITKYNDWIVRVWRKVLSVVSEKYRPEDRRLVRVVGKNNEYIHKVFHQAMLEKPYDVRLQNQSALGDTKAARVSGLMELFGKGVLDVDELRENLELGNLSKVYRDSMEPTQTALWENELMLKGTVVQIDPIDDHEKHYRIHYPMLQQHSTRNLAIQIRGTLEPESEFFGQGMSGHLLNHVKYMVQEIKLEMSIAGQSPRLAKYASLPGFLLLAAQFLSPEDLGAGAGAAPPNGAGPSGNGQAQGGPPSPGLAPSGPMSTMPQESMQATFTPEIPQSP